MGSRRPGGEVSLRVNGVPLQRPLPLSDRMEFLDPRLPDRFWEKVEVASGGCWLWLGYTDRDGYARFSIPLPGGKGSRSALAHRYSYIAARRLNYFKDLQSVDIHHTRCESRSCVNPNDMHEVERLHHRYWHGKMAKYGQEVCTGSVYCLCWRCCEDREKELMEDSIVDPVSNPTSTPAEDVPF